MAKRPSFQFYPSDWLNDLGLRQCSPMARGVWVDLMCLMHDGEPYGHLATKSGELAIPWLANRLGMRKGILLQCIGELQNFDVFSRNNSGIIYSRRMVRDEEIRAKRGDGGYLSQLNQQNKPVEGTHKGAMQGTLKGISTTTVSSSSSSSTSTKNKEDQDHIAPAVAGVSPAPVALKIVRKKSKTAFPMESIPAEWVQGALDTYGWNSVKSETVFDAFMNHHKAHGSLMADWIAAWRKWCGNENKFSRAPTNSGGLFEGHTARAIRIGHERIRETGRL